MPRRQERLGTAGITPGAQAVSGGARVRGGQGRGRVRDEFSSLRSFLGGVANVVGKAGQERGQQEARTFFQIREGENAGDRDTRVEEAIAKHLNKNPLLASSSSPAFQKTLSVLQGGRLSDLISQAVRDRQDELLDLKTDAGVLNTNVPTVNELVQQETDRIRSEHRGAFSDALTTNVVDEGLRRFQTDFGADIAAQQNALKERIGEELLTDEVTLAVFKLGSLESIKSTDLKLIDNLITKLGREGVSPRDARAHGFAGFLAGIEQIARSKADGYGYETAIDIVQAALKEEGGLSIGGRSVRKSEKETRQLLDLEDDLEAEQEREHKRFKRDAERAATKRAVFQSEYTVSKLGFLLDGDSPRRQAESLIEQLAEEFPEDPEKQDLAKSALISRANELENQVGNFNLDPQLEVDIQKLLNDGTPESVDLARQLFEEDPLSISPASRRDFSKRFGQQEVPLTEVLQMPSVGLLREERQNRQRALSGLNPAAKARLSLQLSDQEAEIIQGAVDLMEAGREEEVPGFVQAATKSFRDAADAERIGLEQRKEEFLVAQPGLTAKLSLDRDRLESLKTEGVISLSEYRTTLAEFDQSVRNHRIAENGIQTELLNTFRTAIDGGAESELALTNPSLSDTLEDPQELARFKLDTEAEIRSEASRIYKELLASTPLEDLGSLRNAALQRATNEILRDNVFSVGDEAPKKSSTSSKAVTKNKREVDERLLGAVRTLAPEEFVTTKRELSGTTKSEVFAPARQAILDRAKGVETNTLFRSSVPTLTRVRNEVGAALSSPSLNDRTRSEAALDLMGQTSIPASVVRGGAYSAPVFNSESLVAARKSSEFYKTTRAKLQTYVNARHISILGGAKYAHQNDLGPILDALENSNDLGPMAAFDAIMEDPYFGARDPGSTKDFWLSWHERGDVLTDFVIEAGLVAGNPKFSESLEIPLSDEDIPFRSTPIDMRITAEEAERAGRNMITFYEGGPATTTFQGKTFDLTDGEDALMYFRAKEPDAWRSMMKRAGVDIESPLEVEKFEKGSQLLARKFLKKVTN